MKTKKDKVYEKARKVAAEQNAGERFLHDFDACYTHLYVAINDLPVTKQVLIVVYAMSLGVKAQRNQIRRLLPKGILD